VPRINFRASKPRLLSSNSYTPFTRSLHRNSAEAIRWQISTRGVSPAILIAIPSCLAGGLNSVNLQMDSTRQAKAVPTHNEKLTEFRPPQSKGNCFSFFFLAWCNIYSMLPVSYMLPTTIYQSVISI